MDALTLLKEDHRTVSDIFDKYKKTGDRALKTREKLVRQMITELSAHAFIEEHVFYPAIREADAELEDEVLESMEEHHIVKWVLAELDRLDPSAESFHPKVTVLMENVEHHVQEEEKHMFPRVRKVLSKADLDDLGERLAQAKAEAPAQPELARA